MHIIDLYVSVGIDQCAFNISLETGSDFIIKVFLYLPL